MAIKNFRLKKGAQVPIKVGEIKLTIEVEESYPHGCVCFALRSPDSKFYISAKMLRLLYFDKLGQENCLIERVEYEQVNDLIGSYVRNVFKPYYLYLKSDGNSRTWCLL